MARESPRSFDRTVSLSYLPTQPELLDGHRSARARNLPDRKRPLPQDGKSGPGSGPLGSLSKTSSNGMNCQGTWMLFLRYVFFIHTGRPSHPGNFVERQTTIVGVQQEARQRTEVLFRTLTSTTTFMASNADATKRPEMRSVLGSSPKTCEIDDMNPVV